MRQVNELSEAEWTVNFLTQGGGAAVPTTAEWRLRCMETDTTLQAWTSLSPTTTTDAAGDPEEVSATITVASTLNAMQTSSKKLELKALVISADRGLSTEWNQEIEYQVKRLKARSD